MTFKTLNVASVQHSRIASVSLPSVWAFNGHDFIPNVTKKLQLSRPYICNQEKTTVWQNSPQLANTYQFERVWKTILCKYMHGLFPGTCHHWVRAEWTRSPDFLHWDGTSLRLTQTRLLSTSYVDEARWTRLVRVQTWNKICSAFSTGVHLAKTEYFYCY